MFRSNDCPTPMEVEFDGDLAIEISENLNSGDKCTLNVIVHSGGDPIRPFGIDYDRKSIPDKDEDQYEKILKSIENMAQVMEHDPSTFSKIGEEALRSHILVPLNAQYNGQATAETHNKHGKTDILIQHEGRKIFIAECKFWNGHKSLIAAINQLLDNYSTWHDTKVAVIIFSRNSNFSEVLKSIKLRTKEHPHFKHELGQRSKTSFQFIFSYPDDPHQEITLTVMAFDVPK